MVWTTRQRSAFQVINTSFVNRFFVSYKSPLAVILTLIILGGMFAYSRMQTSLFPEITFPKIKIIAEAALQPVDKMMITVTKPMEAAIKQIPDLQIVRSTTSRGTCEISAFMNWNSDINISQQRIESKISEIRGNLPPEVSITIARMNPSILPVMGYSVESSQFSPIELRQLANTTIKPFLSQVSGVSEVRITGGKTKEYWLELDLQKMSALGITTSTITTALSQTNFIQSSGLISDYKFLYLTLTDATIHNKTELENIIIRNDNKRITLLGDIATIEIREGVEYVKINANGNDGLLVAIIKQPNANLIDISNQIESKISQLQKILPKGVRITPYYIQANFVGQSVTSVTDSVWIGLALALIVAVLFLRSLKASATILITIPITISLVMIVLYGIGYTLNIMTLGAIAAAIGLIIDDAIVVVEQIHRTHEEHPGEPSTVLVPKAVNYLFPAMVGSSLSTIVIFIPFLLMTGVAGSYFNVLTNTMIITLISSFVVTWIGLPVVYLLLTGKGSKLKKNQKEHSVKRQRWVSFFIHRPAISILFVVALIIAVLVIFPKLQTGFLPEMDEGSIVLDYTSPPGTSLDETDRMLKAAEKSFKNIPEIQAFSRRTGTQMGFFITEPNSGDYLIQLKENRQRSTNEVIDDIKQRIETSQPALQIDFGQVIGDMLGDLMASVQPIEIKIYGTDQIELQGLSRKTAELIKSIPGTADVFDGIVIAGPSISVRPDFFLLARYGMSPSDLQSQLQAYITGNLAGNMLERSQLTPIRVLNGRKRNLTTAELKNQKIFLPDGRQVPLDQLAKVTLNAGDAEIQREDLQTMGVITARLDSRDLGSVMRDIQTKVAADIHLPAGYHIEYGGSYADQQQSFNELFVILISASLLVFTVILFLFRNIKVALVILGVSLLGVAGSCIALWLTGTPLNVGSYTGLIMIVGIIGENAIFTFRQFKESLREQNVDDSLVYSISTRLRPKLMTALGAIIALLPLALGIGTGAQLHQPLAIAVIGGFVLALPLLLIVLPSLLRWVYKGVNNTQYTTSSR